MVKTASKSDSAAAAKGAKASAKRAGKAPVKAASSSTAKAAAKRAGKAAGGAKAPVSRRRKAAEPELPLDTSPADSLPADGALPDSEWEYAQVDAGSTEAAAEVPSDDKVPFADDGAAAPGGSVLDAPASGEVSDDERAVRRYLQLVMDPSSLVDRALADRVRAELATVSDPVTKLRLLARLEEAEGRDTSRLQAAFVASALRWAKSEKVSPEAFRSLGVPADVLVEAGLLPRAQAGRTPGLRRLPRRMTSQSEVVDWIASQTEPFTRADAIEALSAAPATVKKALDEALAAGKIVQAGTVPRATQGRAPLLYRPA